MRKITLNKIVREIAAAVDQYNDTEEPGEGVTAQTPEIVTMAVRINVDAIRCYNARRLDKPGTRITFVDGGGFAVTETVEEVDALTDEPAAPPARNGRR